MDVALKVAECVAKTYREDMNSAEVLEGMWLAMQMVGGPKNAAAVVSPLSSIEPICSHRLFSF